MPEEMIVSIIMIVLIIANAVTTFLVIRKINP